MSGVHTIGEQQDWLNGNVARLVASVPGRVAIVNAARDTIICNAEWLLALGLSADLALEPMTTRDLCAQFAFNVIDTDEVDLIHDRFEKALCAKGEACPGPRSMVAWIRDKKTTIETRPKGELLWVTVIEQLDAETSKTEHRQLFAAVENAGQGLAMFDALERLVVCNSQFAQMYSVPPELTAQSTLKSDIEADRADRGLAGERLDQLYETHCRALLDSAKEGGTCFVERENGRLIRVLVRPLADGGTVSSHFDITDQVEQDRENALRQNELLTQNMRLDATVDAIRHGLAMFDADQRLVMCNSAFIDINSLDPEMSIPGTLRADMIANSMKNGFAAKADMDRFFADRAQAIEAKKACYSELALTDGRFIVVGHHPTADGGWVSFHQDITELRSKQALAERRTEELGTHIQRFSAAVNNMAHGLAMFDANKKLVVCNEPFAKMYELPKSLCVSGVGFDDILSHRETIGMIGVEGTAELVRQKIDQQVKERRASRDVILMKNGRYVDILHNPMPDGGWVATHQDITEQRRSERLVAVRSAELDRQNMRFTAAVHNMTHGLSMFDADQNLIICNQTYAELYGLDERLTRPGTSFWDILEAGLPTGMVSVADKDERHRAMTAVIEAGESFRGPVTMINGRVIQVLHQPTPDGGWLATHEDITEEHRSAELIEHMARHDPLTDLPNRTMFNEELGRVEARIGRGEIMAVICLDLDHFKEINDTLGHNFGDRVLQEVSRRIVAAKREGEIAARMGGDEFMLLLGPLEQPHHAASVAQRLIDLIGAPITLDDHQVSVGTSIGIAVAPGDGENGEILMRNADLALYRAKSDGRGHYCFFEQGMDAKMQERRRLERGLRDALVNEEFSLVYQPLLDLQSNRVSGFEALLRWTHPEQGNLPPAKFIPIAEETGLIVPLGRWVLRTACQTAMTWPEHVRVAVNLSPAQFKDRKLIDSVADILRTTGLSPDRLELEITESVLLHHAESNLGVLHSLHRMGVRISVDDFGTGYSALSYLRTFPFDKIKIDRSFIADIVSHSDNDLVNAVIGLGKSLGVMTTAEGVETEMQLDVVRERGCSEVQGFLFSPPLPAQAATELLHVTEARAAAEAGFENQRLPKAQV